MVESIDNQQGENLMGKGQEGGDGREKVTRRRDRLSICRKTEARMKGPFEVYKRGAYVIEG